MMQIYHNNCLLLILIESPVSGSDLFLGCKRDQVNIARSLLMNQLLFGLTY